MNLAGLTSRRHAGSSGAVMQGKATQHSWDSSQAEGWTRQAAPSTASCHCIAQSPLEIHAATELHGRQRSLPGLAGMRMGEAGWVGKLLAWLQAAKMALS